MTPVAVFYQACPVCGRSIRMPVQYFGREVTCVHCGGEFRADEHAAAVPCSQASGSLASGGAPLPGLMPAGLVPHNSLPVTEGR